MPRIRLQYSLTGLAPMPQDTVIDTEALPQALAQEAERLLQPEVLERAAPPSASNLPDSELWMITPLSDDAAPEPTYHLDLSTADEELVVLLDDLRAWVLSEKVRQRRKEP